MDIKSQNINVTKQHLHSLNLQPAGSDAEEKFLIV